MGARATYAALLCWSSQVISDQSGYGRVAVARSMLMEATTKLVQGGSPDCRLEGMNSVYELGAGWSGLR